jgi:hypothetical protein
MPSVPRSLRTYVPKPRWLSYVFVLRLSRALRWAPIQSLVLQARATYLLLCSECLFYVSGGGRTVSPPRPGSVGMPRSVRLFRADLR